MERQSKEDSLALWEFEKNNTKRLGSNISEELIETRRLQIKGLYNCLTNKYIEDGE